MSGRTADDFCPDFVLSESVDTCVRPPPCVAARRLWHNRLRQASPLPCYVRAFYFHSALPLQNESRAAAQRLDHTKLNIHPTAWFVPAPTALGSLDSTRHHKRARSRCVRSGRVRR